MRCLILTQILASSVLLAGCGYSLAGRGSFLPEYIRTIGVPQFTNHTQVFDIDRRVSDRVRAELTNRGKYKVLPAETGADAAMIFVRFADPIFSCLQGCNLRRGERRIDVFAHAQTSPPNGLPFGQQMGSQPQRILYLALLSKFVD